MSDDMELVKRLREYCSVDKGADPLMLKVLSVVRPDLSEAADLIDRLTAQVKTLTMKQDELLNSVERSETTSLRWSERAEAAEAQVARLTEALTEFRNFARDVLPHSPALAARIDLATTALEPRHD